MAKKYVTWAILNNLETSDPRDFMASIVLPTPTPSDLAKLPDNFDLGMYIWATYNQGQLGACTAFGTTHSMLIQNTREAQISNPSLLQKIVSLLKSWRNAITLFPLDLRGKMGHSITQYDWGDSPEHAMTVAVNKGISGLDVNGNRTTFFGKNRAYKTSDSTAMWLLTMRYYLTKYPIVIAISGNNTTWNEMVQGEVKTMIPASKRNWGHCICMGWFSAIKWVHVKNSWDPNNWSQTICDFWISRKNLASMIINGMFNFRYWVLFDAQDAVVNLAEMKKWNIVPVKKPSLFARIKQRLNLK